ncbi:MAG TPA: hypothetical protein VIX20_04445 [Ktedonobacteraceae bacterium]
MDPITAALLAAIAAGVTKGLTQVGQQSIVDGYHRLKELLLSKFGPQSEVVKSVENLEAKPDSKGRKEILQEEVVDSKAEQDPELRQAAQDLLEQIKKQPGGEQHIQQAIGSFVAQADRSSTATVNVNQPKDS